MASVEIEGAEYLQTADAARELELSINSINKAVQRKTLKRRKFGIYNLFHRSEIERYRAEHKGKRGGSRKKSG